MNSYKRSGNRWTVNELITLQREYELLEWTVGQISEKHQRSVEAILYRLESEGLISSWNAARGFNTDQYQSSCTETNQQEQVSVVDEYSHIFADDDEESVLDDCAAEDSEYFDEGDDEDDMSIDDDDQSCVEKLTERVWNLETSVSEINSMVKQMFETMVSKKTTKRAQLRKC